jgi:hypothetical protein
MKSAIVVAALLSSSLLTAAQWLPNGATTGNIYYNNGYVGLGTSSPASRLHISTANSRETLRLYLDGNTTNYLSMWQGVGAAAIDPKGTGKLYLGYDQATDIYLSHAGGNVGIGTTAPQEKLHVEGNLYMGTNQVQFLSASGGNNRIQSAGGAGIFGAWIFKSRFDHIVLDAGENSANARAMYFKIGGADKMALDSDGNLGVGTAYPVSQLHVASDNTHSINLSRSNGTYGFRILRNATEGNVYFQIGNALNSWETKIKIGEGEGPNTKLILNPNGGSVGIGTENPGSYKLAVNGKIWTQEVNVTMTNPGPDYVFDKDYDLLSLSEIEQYILQHKHLPEVPSAKEMESDGVNLKEMNLLLLKKVEELTLHIIELEKRVKRVEN